MENIADKPVAGIDHDPVDTHDCAPFGCVLQTIRIVCPAKPAESHYETLNRDMRSKISRKPLFKNSDHKSTEAAMSHRPNTAQYYAETLRSIMYAGNVTDKFAFFKLQFTF